MRSSHLTNSSSINIDKDIKDFVKISVLLLSIPERQEKGKRIYIRFDINNDDTVLHLLLYLARTVVVVVVVCSIST